MTMTEPSTGLKDGRVVEGVVEVRKSDVLVLSRFGTTAIPRDQIEKHVKGPSVDAQIKKHLAALEPEDLDGFFAELQRTLYREQGI